MMTVEFNQDQFERRLKKCMDAVGQVTPRMNVELQKMTASAHNFLVTISLAGSSKATIIDPKLNEEDKLARSFETKL